METNKQREDLRKALEEEHGKPTADHEVGKAEGWYDKNGLKCITCQKALDQRIIPPSLIKKPESSYTETELRLYFNLKKPVLNAWIKKGLITTRIIASLGKGVHIRLFLLRDNKGFLPPKKLMEGGVHTEEKDGKEEFVFGPWYWYCDPFEKLAKYGIVQYMGWETPKDGDSPDTPVP